MLAICRPIYKINFEFRPDIINMFKKIIMNHIQTYRSVLYSVFNNKEIKPLIGQLIDVRLCSQYQGGTTRSLVSGRDTCGRGESSVATECEPTTDNIVRGGGGLSCIGVKHCCLFVFYNVFVKTLTSRLVF